MGEGFSELVQVYFDVTPKLISRLREAAGNSDHAVIAEVTHSLKSSSANIGALPFAEMARNAEAEAKAQRSDHLGSLPQRLDNEYRRVLDAFASIGLVPELTRA